jgi:hypothetical protein
VLLALAVATLVSELDAALLEKLEFRLSDALWSEEARLFSVPSVDILVL